MRQPPEITELQRRAIRLALREDAATNDVTSRALVPEEAAGAASIVVKQAGVLSGADIAVRVFGELRDVGGRVEFELLAWSGDKVQAGQEVARLKGPLRVLLAGERTAVNIVQRMSGIATLTAQFVAAVAGTRAKILATRKTAPGLRGFDVAAVRAGGGDVHRASLADRVLVKENHLLAARAAGTAKSMADIVALLATEKPRVPIGIEAVDLDELRAALVPGVDVVLLDNMPPEKIVEAVKLRAAAFPKGGGPAFEASGGITLANVRSYADAGVEQISVGALTHSAPALDVSMRIARA